MNRLINLIKQSFNIDFDIYPDTPLISSGIIDSLHVAQFLVLLQQEYGKVITPRDIGTDNFDTPEQIESYLNKP